MDNPHKNNGPENQAIPNQENEPTLPKIGELDEPFEYAPKKPDGDHWENLLRPLLEGDKAQCDIWKDEVSNLLIFAGLFSAVVTAFIIESYKSLQRDPNQDMIILLSQIVDRLGNNTSTGSSPPSAPLPTFSPSSSSIRINVFWFISLILSLTTVLVGIISLQWLREHQNYATLTPMQKYAIFHMRRDGLEKWHVGKIFTAMPLLLQSALVLFFTGIIDFLLAFGDIAVVIPVAVVIGLTLLFLVITTLFPTIQGFFLFKSSVHPDHSKLPAQCPYKSPQSNVIRAISLPIFFILGVFCATNRTLSDRAKWKRNETFIRCINYSDRTWLAFDLQWSAIRDGFMRRAFNRPLEYHQLGYSTDLTTMDVLPIWDILQGLISQKHPDISSVYYAYTDVSDKIFAYRIKPGPFVQDTLEYGRLPFRPDINFLELHIDISDRADYTSLARHQAFFQFLSRISDDNNEVARRQMSEIYLRLMVYLCKNNTLVPPQSGQMVWPCCLQASYMRSSFDTSELQVMLLQLITTLFTQMTTECNPHALVNHLSFAYLPFKYLAWQPFDLIESNHQGQRAIATLLDLMNTHLIQEIHTVIVPGSGTAKATLPFYASAMFASKFIPNSSGDPWKPSLETFLSTIRQYKELSIDQGLCDSEIEKELGYRPYSTRCPFTADWWSKLLKDVPPLDPSTIDDIPQNNAQPLPPDTSSAESVVPVPAGVVPHISITMDDPTNVIPDRLYEVPYDRIPEDHT